MKQMKKETPLKKRKVVFTLNAKAAQRVYVAGEFNAWNPTEYPMKKGAEGKWMKQLSLPPGDFQYKFLVDDQWVEDPENESTCPNCFGTCNSLIHITP